MCDAKLHWCQICILDLDFKFARLNLTSLLTPVVYRKKGFHLAGTSEGHELDWVMMFLYFEVITDAKWKSNGELQF